ncbi:MAG: hypothetical protein KatS3mg076_0628 [Candidatus Binatia bacterium]|nr:MAG: hypothetical protein KatS3mg076_0628 [Candidatus Binatia bacterium]
MPKPTTWQVVFLLPLGACLASPPKPAPPLARAAEPESDLPPPTRIVPAGGPQLAASPAQAFVEQGREAFEAGRFDLALDRLETAVRIDPTNAEAYYWLARLHYRRGRPDQAVAFARKAALLFSRVDLSWASRAYAFEGAVLEELGEVSAARDAYGKALENDPGNPAARAGLARLGLFR